MTTLTAAQLTEFFPKSSNKNIQKFTSPLLLTLKKYEIQNPSEIAMFLAQIRHESGNLHYVEEIASGEAYTLRADLGNTTLEAITVAKSAGISAGKLYKGRGLIQITGYFNYKACGEALAADFIHMPTLLATPIYAALSAGWFWKMKKCDVSARAGDIIKNTKIINGGINGLAERTDYFKENLKIVKEFCGE